MPTAETAQRPIGYYLKQLDHLIEDRFERDLADHRVSRRHWQVLNVLHAGPSDHAALAEALQPFWTASGITLETVLDELEQRGAVRHDDHDDHDDGSGGCALTPAGRALHAALHERVAATRELLLDGLTADDYRATVTTLQRMARNLATAQPAQPDRPG